MISSNDISVDFLELLTKAGWVETRRVDVAKWLDSFFREGFTRIPFAIEILESLGGLTIYSSKNVRLQFDPYYISGDYDKANALENAIGIKLFPIAYDWRAGNPIWVDMENFYYYGMEYGVFKIGENFKDAMDRVAFGKGPVLKIHEGI